MYGWESNKFKLHAIMSVPGIGAQDPSVTFYFDIIQYSHEFELNSIPTCTLSLALGRRGDSTTDPDAISMVHRAINVLKVQVEVVVYCKARTLDGTNLRTKWPVTEANQPKEFIVFRGNASSGAFTKAFGSVRYVLSLTHWLADLAYSSALSQQTHPTTPNSFFFPAAFNLIDPFGGGLLPVGAAAYTGVGTAMKYFLPSTLTKDFWGGHNPGARGNTGLKQWFVTLSSQDRLNPLQINIGLSALGLKRCHFDKAAKNTDALNALARFEPIAYQKGEPPYYRLGVPLPLDSHGAHTAIIAKLLGESIGLESLDAYANVTLWDKLAGELHANFLFSVVPTVESAIVVPFIPGLRAPYHRYIRSDEYEHCDIFDNLPRSLRAVAVMMGRTWSAGANLSRQQPPEYAGIGGWFGTCRPGMVLFKQAPFWLTSISPSFYSGQTAPNGVPIGTAFGPQGPQGAQGPQGPQEPLIPPAGIFKKSQEIWNAYAQALYVYELLKHRQGVLSGPVRFDIAPGSLLRIEAAEDKFTWALLGNKNYMHAYAAVLRVSTTIDAEAQRASTSFALAHVRTEAENIDQETSICRHPLWSVIWSGCTLVDDPAFDPVATWVTSPPLVQLICGQIPDIPSFF